MSQVELIDVSKRFDDGTTAVEGFSLAVEAGELVVLVGPSGCGKSTLLRLIAGLEETSGGRIRIGGREMEGVPPQQRELAMVFQNYALYPHMTVRGNLEFPLKMMRLSKGERAARVAETAELLGLGELLDRRPKELSGGQRQRVAMGRAVVRRPRLLLMDEPLSNLDAKLRVRLRAEIAALQKRLGTTLLYVTHDQAEAMTLGDRVVVVRDGRIQQQGAPLEVYHRPANRFVAGFLGSPGMNLFPCTLVEEGDGMAMEWGGGRLPLLLEEIEQSARLAPWIGQPLTGGLRPEAFHPGGRFEAAVETFEALGHESLIYFRLPGVDRPLAARLPGAPPGGAAIGLSVDIRGLRFFDEQGRAL